LSRITTAGRTFIPQIDGLRFVAIMAVMAYHVRGFCLHRLGQPPTAGGAVGYAFDAGHLGVQLFFAISGFILSLPFAKQIAAGGPPVGLREYYARRLTRIEPPYLIHLCFLFALCALVLPRVPAQQQLYPPGQGLGYGLAHLLPSAVYANGFIYAAHPYPNAVLWSLEVEVQFYLLAPLLARLFAVPGRAARLGLLAGPVLGLSVVNQRVGGSYRVMFSLAGNLQFFLVGFLLAECCLAGWLKPGRRGWLWDCGFLCGAALVLECHHWAAISALLPCAILACCVGAFRGALGSRLFSHPWIVTIGGMCYTIYMYHWLMISVLSKVTTRLRTGAVGLDLLIQFVVLAASITFICAFLFMAFERPFMRRHWPTALWAALRERMPANRLSRRAA
jgi:peptidoglycan/LPS O-acetylase OafA/YrhL